MAKDNITPIYGEWLCKNLKYYQFSGKEAEDLKKRLEAIDVTNVEYDEELVICYRKFLQLFHNNMFEMAFCPPRDGITTTHIKAFLAPNAYGVMTPMAFLEENNSKYEYEFDAKAKEVQSLEPKETENVDYKSLHEDIEKISKWKKNQYANVFRGIIVAALVVFGILKAGSVFELLSSDEFQTIRLGISAALILGAWKGFVEILAGIKRIRFFKVVKLCNSVFLTGTEGASRSGADSNQLEAYKEVLKKALIEDNPTELPGVAGKNAEDSGINKHLRLIKAVIKKNKKIKKRAGLFTFLFLLAAIYVLLFGYNSLLMQDKNDNENYRETATSTPKPSPTEVPKKKVAYTEEIKPSGVQASSERVSSKGTVFGIDLTIDDDIETCWQDGVSGDGTQEWLSYSFDKVYNISSISILNGRVISEEKYFANGRMQKVTIQFHKNGIRVYEMEVTLEDVFNVVQTIDIGEGIEANGVIITVDTIYHGTDYKDLCVTEISFTNTYYEYE